MATIQVNGIRLAYDERGTGPAVVMVHAGIADRRMWEHQYLSLSDRYRAIRYDWRGYGESDQAVGEFAHYQDLLGLLDALGLEQATLVGCSMGAAYAVDAALAAPARVKGLVLISAGLSGHRWPPRMLEQVRERVHSAVPAERLQRYWQRSADTVDPADVVAMAEAQVRFMVAGPSRSRDSLSPEVYSVAVEMCRLVFERLWRGPSFTERPAQPPAEGRLHEICAPTLVINGLADVPEIQEVCDLLGRGVQGARRIDLPDTGHLPPLERPALVTAALAEFLDMHA